MLYVSLRISSSSAERSQNLEKSRKMMGKDWIYLIIYFYFFKQSIPGESLGRGLLGVCHAGGSKDSAHSLW